MRDSVSPGAYREGVDKVSATTKERYMKLYTFKLGNTIARKGHRHDCAQVAITVWVKARNAIEATAILQSAAKLTREGFSLPFAIEVQVNPDTVRETNIIKADEARA